MPVTSGERSRPDRIRVLHVDDDGVTDTTAAFLERDERIQVVTEASAGDGLDRLADGTIDCVVSGYELPGLDGIEFLETVRESHPDRPFVLFTGAGDEGVASDAITAGVTDYLRKGHGVEQYDLLGNRILNAVEQYRAERERRRDERRFEAVFEDPKMHVGLLEPDGTVLRINRTALDAAGADRDAVVGEPFPATPWWNHSAELQADLRRWIDRAAAGEYVEYEVEHPDRDGDLYSVEGTVRPVTDDAGEVMSLIASARDVTERAERAHRIEALHTATRELMAADTEEAVAEMTVRAAANTLGFPRNVVRLRDDDLLVPVAVSEGMGEELGSDRPAYEIGQPTAGVAFERGETVVYDDLADLDDDVDHTPGASMYVPIGQYGVLTVSGTVPDAFDGTDVDLAELLAAHAEVALERVERARELRRRNERLDEFASIVAHDLRNPLNVLDGSLDLLRETGDPAHLRQCASAADRMGRLIDDLLTVARGGAPVEDPEPVRLAPLVETCWEAVGGEGATLDVDASLTVRADEDRLRQLFENLLRNGVEHGSTNDRSTPDDSGDHTGSAVTVEVGELGDGDGFYVADDGPGIPDAERERIFRSGYSTATDGTGFGLAIVERIAEAHGWEVRATESRAGGARIEVGGVRTERFDPERPD
ncbi:MAG: ATP-binding protein [Haloferacaceae archaeon]